MTQKMILAYPSSSWNMRIGFFAWKNQHPIFYASSIVDVQPKAKICENPIERNLSLGRKLGVNGTPTLIFSNGLKMVGGRSAADIQMIWKELGL